jgi:hypothetical protein
MIVSFNTCDFIVWPCQHTTKFPRNQRFTLGERIERNLYALLETLLRAKYSREWQAHLQEANLMLEILRFQMRLAKDLQCPRVDSYGFAVSPLGRDRQWVGGWRGRNANRAGSPGLAPGPLCDATGPGRPDYRPRRSAFGLRDPVLSWLPWPFVVAMCDSPPRGPSSPLHVPATTGGRSTRLPQCEP